MDAVQTNNGKRILRVVAQEAKDKGWSSGTATRVADMAIMCAMTESNLYVYANKNNQESLHLPHEQVGSDHASVGLFQQQVPGWGTTADCMNVETSTRKFLHRLEDLGLATWKGPANWVRIQSVQVSAYVDASNYRANRWRAYNFLLAYWAGARRAVK